MASTLSSIVGLEERASLLLSRVAREAEERERLKEVTGSALRDVEAQGVMAKVKAAYHVPLSQLIKRVGDVAARVNSFAAATTQRSATMRQLHNLLARVEATEAVTESLFEMDKSIKEISDALSASDVERVVSLIKRYDEAKQRAFLYTNEGLNTEWSAILGSHVVDEARDAGKTLLVNECSQAQESADKEKLIACLTLLSQLGHTELATDIFCRWCCQTALVPLRSAVAAELEKIDTPNAAKSHLILISQLLDEAAATFEGEEGFVTSTFGPNSTKKFLAELHAEATSSCVPVLKDFILRRQDVTSVLGKALKTMKLETSGKTASSSAASLAVAARRADQVLEEISHIASCCHVYFLFYQKHTTATEAGSPDKGTEKEDGVDYLWASQDNPLLGCLQEALSMYCPIQLQYFEVAFAQALALQSDALENLLQKRKKNEKRNVSDSEEGELPPVLRIFCANSNSRAGPSSGDGGPDVVLLERIYCDNANIVTLHDDVFYVLRIALHRAFNTKSTQVIFAVLACISDVIRESFLPEVDRRTVVRRNLFAPSTLRWISAAQKSSDYLLKLSEELMRLATQTYSDSVVQQMKEYGNDMTKVHGPNLRKKVGDCVEECARAVFSAVSVKPLAKLQGMSFVMTEETLSYYELNDPWSQMLVHDCNEVVEDVGKLCDHETFNHFLLALTKIMVQSLREKLSSKKFNVFGSMQIERDVQAICFWLSDVCSGSVISVREACAALTLTTWLLMVDSPRDALDEAYNGALTAEEKKKVLLQRVDLDETEVRLLKL